MLEVLIGKYANLDRDDFEKLFNETLRLTERDGYLIAEDGYVAFRSPVLRDYWRNRYFPDS